LNNGEPRLPLWVLAYEILQASFNCRHLRLRSLA
jgi:hypothetical protein